MSNAIYAYEDALGKPEFKPMFELAAAWQEKEVRLNIQNAELRPRLHGDEAIRVDVKWPNEATRMIESFMVATNTSIGHYPRLNWGPSSMAMPHAARRS